MSQNENSNEDALIHVALVGMVRSGTTFVERELARNLHGVAVGELPGIWAAWHVPGRQCSCGAVARECTFWSNVAKHYPNLDDPDVANFMRARNRAQLPIRNVWMWPRILKRSRNPVRPEFYYASEIRKLYSAINEVARHQEFGLVADSSKHPLWYSLARRSGAFDMFQRNLGVRLIRHPHSVYWSLQNPQSPPQEDGVNPPKQVAVGLLKSVPYWLVMNLVADLVVRDALYLKYEEINFETLLNDSRVKAVLSEPVGGNDGLVLEHSHQLMGNPGRPSQARKFSRDDRWRGRSLTIAEKVAWASIWPVLRNYDYGLRPPE